MAPAPRSPRSARRLEALYKGCGRLVFAGGSAGGRRMREMIKIDDPAVTDACYNP